LAEKSVQKELLLHADRPIFARHSGKLRMSLILLKIEYTQPSMYSKDLKTRLHSLDFEWPICVLVSMVWLSIGLVIKWLKQDGS
jgi:hypothetical protein